MYCSPKRWWCLLDSILWMEWGCLLNPDCLQETLSLNSTPSGHAKECILTLLRSANTKGSRFGGHLHYIFVARPAQRNYQSFVEPSFLWFFKYLAIIWGCTPNPLGTILRIYSSWVSPPQILYAVVDCYTESYSMKFQYFLHSENTSFLYKNFTISSFFK